MSTSTRATLGLSLFCSACLLLSGCHAQSDPDLRVQQVRHWPIPAIQGKVPAPRSVEISGDEVFILDTAGRVLVTDLQGTVTRQWFMPEYEVGKAEDLLVLSNGNLAVADTHYHRIVFFSRAGDLLDTWGEYGTESGQFIYPVALAEDDQGNLFVGEYGGNDRIQVFSPDGEPLRLFGHFGTEQGAFQRPSGLVWRDGRLYVADAINHRIQVFADDGTYETTIAGGPTTTRLAYPYDLAAGGTEELYVVEYGRGCVTRLAVTGAVLGRWGQTGSGTAHLATPWGLAVSARRILVTDTGNRRVVELEL